MCKYIQQSYYAHEKYTDNKQMSFDLSKLSNINFKAHVSVCKIYDDTSCIPYILNIACAYI